MKTIVITGSTRGIGLGLAREFWIRNCNVVVCGRSREAVDRAVAEVGQVDGAGRIAGVPCDVTHLDDVQQLWDQSIGAFGRVDVWINNAGANSSRLPVWQLAVADITSVVNVNLIGTMFGSKVAIAGMLSQGGGQVWNVEGFGSNGKFAPGLTAYGATKSGVTYLTHGLIKEVEGGPVQVCLLNPGMVDTGMLRSEYTPEQWEKSKRILNILTDKVETVTPFLADRILAADKNGARVDWLSNAKLAGRFISARFRPRHVLD